MFEVGWVHIADGNDLQIARDGSGSDALTGVSKIAGDAYTVPAAAIGAICKDAYGYRAKPTTKTVDGNCSARVTDLKSDLSFVVRLLMRLMLGESIIRTAGAMRNKESAAVRSGTAALPSGKKISGEGPWWRPASTERAPDFPRLDSGKDGADWLVKRNSSRRSCCPKTCCR